MDRLKMTEFYDENSIDAQDALTPVQEFLQDQNHCCLCGSELKFDHRMDHLTLTVVEDAKCDDCHISLRTKTHSLQ